MNKDYVSHELAKKLKSAGFDEPCDYCYITRYGTSCRIFERGLLPNKWNSEETDNPSDPYQYMSAPTLAHSQKWLREKWGIDIEIRVWLVGGEREYRPYIMPPKRPDFIAYPPEKSYEQALSTGIFAALELIKKGE